MSTAVNENLIRGIVEEVLGRLSKAGAPGGSFKSAARVPVEAQHATMGCFKMRPRLAKRHTSLICSFVKKGVAGRRRVEEIVKTLAYKNSAEWGRIELEETKIGRLDHKIGKLTGLKAVPGVDYLRPEAFSGDHGITLEEWAPFGVIAAITPSTHSIPTLSCNVINMAAAGNAVVFNAHHVGLPLRSLGGTRL